MTDAEGTRTILFTDVEGSTQMRTDHGDAGAHEILRSHEDLVRQAVAEHDGREVKALGDGFLVVFASVRRAVRCAVEIQRLIAAHNKAHAGPRIAVRIGLNTGEVTEEGGDLFGQAVNAAARIAAKAQGGQIFVSDIVRQLAGAVPDITFTDRGRVKLKGFDDRWRLFEVGWPEEHAALAIPPPLARADDGRFVGRGDEAAHLHKLWDTTRVGEAHLALIGGEPGIGKTRLSAQFSKDAHEAGAVVLYGRCDDESIVPYQPFVEALTYFVRTASEDAVAGALEAAGPEIARMLPDVPGAPASTRAQDEPDIDRYRLFEAVASMLAEIARETSLVLVLDDLHWADKPTLVLLRHVMRARPQTPMLVVGTYRDVELDRTHPLAAMLVEMRRDTRTHRIPVRGLSVTEVRALLERRAGHTLTQGGLALAEGLWRATEGNPFFIAEIVRHLAETGRIYVRDGVWVSDARTVDELAIPESVREVIGRRLSRLGEGANRVLSFASVLGPEFVFEVVAAMTDGTSSDELLDAIDEALGANLIVERPDRPLPTYAFTHALVRDTLYQELSLPRKQRLHLKAAQAIETVCSSDIERQIGALALHCRLAGAAADPDKSLSYSLRAANSAATLFAWEEAVLHLQAAAELMADQGAPPEARAAVLQRLGDLVFLVGTDLDASDRYISEAIALYESIGDPARAAFAHARLGRNLSTYSDHMDIERAVDHLARAEAVIGSSGHTRSVAWLYNVLAGAHLWGVRTTQGLAAAERAVEFAAQGGGEGLKATADILHGYFIAHAGRLAEGLVKIEDGWGRADRIDHAFAAFLGVWVRGAFAYFALDGRDAIHWWSRDLEKPRFIGAPIQRSIALELVAQSYAMLGELDTARSLLADEPTQEIPWARNMIAFWSGDWTESNTRWDEFGMLDAASTGNRWSGWGVAYQKAALSFLAEDLEQARAHAEEVVEVGTGGGSLYVEMWARPLLSQIETLAGNLSAAAEHLARAEQILSSGEDWRGLAGRVAQARAVLRSARGEDASDDFARAVEIFERYETPWDTAEAYYLWARALREAGDARASEKADAAIAIYTERGGGSQFIDRARAMRV